MISRKQKRQKSRVTKTNPLKLNPKKRCVAYCVTHLRLMRSLNRRRRPTTPQSDAEVVVHKTSDGDKYIDLGKKKRATVRSFKGMPLLDIRSSMGKRETKSQAKKGISLSLEQVRPLLFRLLCAILLSFYSGTHSRRAWTPLIDCLRR